MGIWLQVRNLILLEPGRFERIIELPWDLPGCLIGTDFVPDLKIKELLDINVGRFFIGLESSSKVGSPFSSRTSIRVATMYHGSVSIDVRDELSIDLGWKISVDGRVASVDGDLRPQLSLVGLEKVSIDAINELSIDTHLRSSIDTTTELSIDFLLASFSEWV
ncbi:hypothetical protein F2Q69_00058780 [Brassica cretica]|uniref:Uncharacterized protein n=1 Tax=Brassica cretica TaxID=69181 RepID=A0A8S9RNZ3_BRACR|nr:hypothetical protein F2Q69_00058780 [Brassica cretica]